MKKLLLAGLTVLLFANVYSQNKLLRNPASVYVKFLGYSSKYKTDSLGNQTKICVLPDSSECDEWQFFRGLCGQDFSYCAIKGCLTENYTDSLNHSSYAICICTDSTGNKHKIPLIDFMEQNGDSLFSTSNRHKKGER